MKEFYTSRAFDELYLALIVTSAFFAWTCLSWVSNKRQSTTLPRVKSQEKQGLEERRRNYLSSCKKLFSEGYDTFKDTVWVVTNEDGVDTYVTPSFFLPELRKIPDNALSFGNAIAEFMKEKDTRFEFNTDILGHIIRADLTPALARLNPAISAEVDEALRHEMPTCEDWTSVRIFGILTRVVARVSGRIFVGPELCQNEQYIEASGNYMMEVLLARNSVAQMRPILRPFLASRTPEVKQIRKREKAVTDFLTPIVESRLKAELDPSWQAPDDMIQWFLRRREHYKIDTPHKLAKLQLAVIFAAIQTTVETTTNIFYSLAVTPEYMEPLRKEIRATLHAHGGEMTVKALHQMEQLDSYMKEKLRVYTPGYITFQRKVLKGVTLSNGQHIPQGSRLQVASYAVHHDPANYPDPNTFDGLRAYKQRQSGINSFPQARSILVLATDGMHALDDSLRRTRSR